MSSADNLCKQFGPYQARQNNFLKKLLFKKSADDKKREKNLVENRSLLKGLFYTTVITIIIFLVLFKISDTRSILKTLFGCIMLALFYILRVYILKLKLVDYLLVHTHKPYSNLHVSGPINQSPFNLFIRYSSQF